MTLSISVLEEKAAWVRRKVLEMAVRANSGHVSTAMSQTEILVALYYGGILRYDPKDPKSPDRDIFLLSKGQGGIGLYPILADCGFFPKEELDHFCEKGSHIGVHAEWHCPGVEMISGSLGHGLPVATGICQALKNDKKDNLVYCLVGDGELHEGSNWEALLTAGHLKLGNLIVIVDRNGQNTIGRTREPMEISKDGPGLDSLRAKFEAFGFDTLETDGHDLDALLEDLCWPRGMNDSKPLCIIANTLKGKGLSPIEDKRDWHYRVPMGEDLTQCWDDLGVPAEERPVPSTSQVKHSKAMRDRFFEALLPHFQASKNYVLITADNGFPKIDEFAKLEGQFYQVGIAEQQMVGMAAGMAMQGRKVFCYAIAPFVGIRVLEFVKLDVCAMNLDITMVGIGAGLAYDIMCVTHHAADDISTMRALPNMKIYSPSDGVTAAKLADIIVRDGGPSYIRLDRGGINDIYCDDDYFETGLIMPEGDIGGLTFVATGAMVHRAIEVSKQFPSSTVIDLYRLKPLNTKSLVSLLSGTTGVVSLEEHQLNGGLGSILAEFISDHNLQIPLLRLGINDRFMYEMGGREHLQELCGLDTNSIVHAVKEWQSSLNSCCGGSCCDLES